jgi:hypothetical protein
MEHRFGPLPSRDKSRVMAASTAMLAAMKDRLVDAASVREVFFAGIGGHARHRISAAAAP